ncbi:MAG: DUF2192 domain-containing protein [Nitrososphaerales archaeon]
MTNKYYPQYLIDKDIAGAYVIGRRGLGYKDDVPENYLKLLSNKEYLESDNEIYGEFVFTRKDFERGEISVVGKVIMSIQMY